jgi:hypothetical protein
MHTGTIPYNGEDQEVSMKTFLLDITFMEWSVAASVVMTVAMLVMGLIQ